MVGTETGDVAITSVTGVMALLQHTAIVLDVYHRITCVAVLHGTGQDTDTGTLCTEFHWEETVTWVLLEVLTAVQKDLAAMHVFVTSLPVQKVCYTLLNS